MFDFGPLYKNRKEIAQKVKEIGIQNGDIFFRSSNAKGPFGLPFSRLVAFFTRSDYTHASVAVVEEDGIYLLEVNDRGTLKYRLIDWLDTCYSGKFSIHRLLDAPEGIEEKLENEIRKILKNDPDYDFTFQDPDKFYCTESVAHIYQQVGIQLVEPEYIKDIVPKWFYYILVVGNWFFAKFSQASFPLDRKLYYVGDSDHGLMSSDYLYCVYLHEEK